MPNLTNLGLAPQPATPTAQDRQNAFLNAAADRKTVAPDRVAARAWPYVLQAGAVISAALITGIRSDLPGQITAQVTENIYDSPTGRILLVPQGTRVIGQYDNNVQFGQSRVLLVWNRLIFPNGRSIVLERQPGADAEGYARTVSTITGGTSRRPRAFPRSSALARSSRLTMMIVWFALSATAARTRSTMLANRSSADN
jgi:type IV secretion system protein TrbI